MRRVIDLECVLPPDENGVARQYFGAAGHRIGEGDPELLPPLAGYGFENYRNIFTRREGGARQPDAAKPAGKSLAADRCGDGSRRRANLGDPSHAERPAGEDRAGLSDALLRPRHAQPVRRNARRPRTGEAGARGEGAGHARRRAVQRPRRQRPALLPALCQMRRAGHSGAHLCVDELRQRSALRSRPPAPPRPGGDRLPGAQDHRRPGRLAVDQ